MCLIVKIYSAFEVRPWRGPNPHHQHRSEMMWRGDAPRSRRPKTGACTNMFSWFVGSEQVDSPFNHVTGLRWISLHDISATSVTESSRSLFLEWVYQQFGRLIRSVLDFLITRATVTDLPQCVWQMYFLLYNIAKMVSFFIYIITNKQYNYFKYDSGNIWQKMDR